MSAPYLRYPLWRFTAMAVTGAALISGAMVAPHVYYDNYIRREKWIQFFDNFDAYAHAKEICSHSPGLMHSCPKDLAIMMEKKGLK